MHFRFILLLYSLSIILLFLPACGNRDQRSRAVIIIDSLGAASAHIQPRELPKTAITKLQGMMVVQQKIGDFHQWLAAYEANDSMRLANGVHRYMIGRNLADSNTIFIVMKVDDLAKAKAFSKSDGLKQAMKNSGAISPPAFSFLVATYQDTAAMSTTIHSYTVNKVYDWDIWQRVYDFQSQDLASYGMAIRIYGQDLDNDELAFAVTAILDTTKASGFWKSEEWTNRKAASGVIKDTNRLFWKVIRAY